MRYTAFALLLIGCLWAASVPAGEPVGKSGHGRCLFCPRCSEPCFPSVTTEAETRHCWDVECKTICIPRVRFPWEGGGLKGGKGICGCLPPKCGKAKCVKGLMKCEYECDVCKYKWEVEDCKGKWSLPEEPSEEESNVHDEEEGESEEGGEEESSGESGEEENMNKGDSNEIPMPPALQEARSAVRAHNTPAPVVPPRRRIFQLP